MIGYDVHYGPVSEKKPDWRKTLKAEPPDDDKELAETPKDVLDVLGFDPKEFSEE